MQELDENSQRNSRLVNRIILDLILRTDRKKEFKKALSSHYYLFQVDYPNITVGFSSVFVT